MTKITLTPLVNLQNETTAVNAINANNAVIVAAIDNTLSRNGISPNQMAANLDMNSNRILNLPTPASPTEPLRLLDANTLNGGGSITVQNVPSGGTTGQSLKKNSNTNFDMLWGDVSGILPVAGTTGQTLVKTSGADFATGWNSSNLPAGGSSGQFLTKSSSSDYATQWTSASLTLAAGKGISITGSGPTTIAIRDYLSVKDFGAVGDGVTDDTTAIQAAITTAAGGAAAHTPITVFFPNGNYKITTALTIPSTTFIIGLLGENRLGTKITSTSSINGLIYNASNFGSLDMRNITWVTPAATSVTIGSPSISVTQCTIDNCAFNSSSTAINVQNGSAINITECFFNQFTTAAIQISAPLGTDSGDCWIHKCYFLNSAGLSGTGICVNLNSGGGWKITNCKMLNAQYGIFYFASLAGGNTSEFHVQNNSIEGMLANGVAISNQSSVSGNIENIVITGNEVGGGLNGSGILVAAAGGRKWCSTCLISGNVIRTTSGVNCINVDGILTNININSNVCDDANANPSGFAIQVGTNSSNGFIATNSITNYTNKVNNAGTNVTAINNGP